MRLSSLVIALASGCSAVTANAQASEIFPTRYAVNVPNGVAGPFASAETVSDELLDQQRGGFVIHGMNVNLGADIRTYINGELMLRTTVSWADTGVLKEQFSAQGISPANAASLNASALANGKINMDLGGTPIFTANDGQTMLIHRVENGLQNILLNTASNLDIVQEVDASIELGGYDAFHDSIISNRLSDSISSAIGAMTIGAAFGQ
jgi:hypothetical protein